MQQEELIPHLFRTEYRKIVAVLCKVFGIEHLEIAEDIASETFLLATETWGLKGLPENPTAWLYAVSKNKATDYLRRTSHFNKKIAVDLTNELPRTTEIEIDLSNENINDSQLQMMFAVCHPSLPPESQIGLSLSILCGFGVEEIADAFLSNKETIYKRLARAKEKLRMQKVEIEIPTSEEINERLATVLTTLYLLFNEGYYSSSQNTTLRKDFCVEAMRLTHLLVENESTNTPPANALLSLMCFHSSRFDARIDNNGELVLYQEQNTSLWNQELISRGEYYLNESARGNVLSKYHLEAGIAYWHTQKNDSTEKWENILQYYNKLLQLEYSPIAALNRTYALSKASGKKIAILEAEQLKLDDHYLFHSLLGNLYSDIDDRIAIEHFEIALKLVKSQADKTSLTNHIRRLKS